MNKSIEIIVCGHLCLDITPKFNIKRDDLKIFSPGRLTNVGEMAISTGGPVSNTGLSLFKLGAKVGLLSKIGDDFTGREILDFLKNFTGVKEIPGIKVVKDEQSSYSIILSPPKIDRIIFHNPGCNNTFGYDDIDFNLVKKAKFFHFGYPPLMRKIYLCEGEELIKIFKKVKSLNVATSLDMSLPDPESESGRVDWRNILKRIMRWVDIFLPSFEEIMFMMNRKKFYALRDSAKAKGVIDLLEESHLREISDELLEFGGKIIGIKCGYRGFYVRTAKKEALERMELFKNKNLNNWSNREIFIETFKIRNIVSTLGSGDAAVAGFLMAILKGETIEDAVKSANCVAAQNLTSYDAVSGVKTWNETLKTIKKKGGML